MMIHVMLQLYFFILLFKAILSQGLINYDEVKGNSFKSCSSSIQQSPIDIPFYDIKSNSFNQHNSQNYINRTVYTLLNGEMIKLDNDGILKIVPDQITLKHYGLLYATIGGRYTSYKLTEIRFHINSEHTFQGMKTEMEIQLMHEHNNNDGPIDFTYQEIGLSLLFSTSWDEDSELLTPLVETKTPYSLDLLNKYSSAKITSMDFNQFFFKHNPYYYYKGSGTTPSDCSFIHHWFIMKKVEKMSWKQLNQIQALMYSIYPNGNSRKTVEVKTTPPTKIEYIEYNKGSYYFQCNISIALIIILTFISL